MTDNRATPDYHQARLLVLLSAFPKGISGLTKLAKLDFLLRYPTMLEQLLLRDEIAVPDGIAPSDNERISVESPMIRYKYGPWDDQYYSILGSLVGKALVDTTATGRSIQIRLTERGADIARAIADEPLWSTTAARASILRRHYDKSGNALKERIYAEFPEAMARPYWTPIDPIGAR